MAAFKKDEMVVGDSGGAAAFKAEWEQAIKAKEAESEYFLDSLPEACAKLSERATEMKSNKKYIDACEVVKGLDAPNGNFMTKLGADAQEFEEKPPEDAKGEPKRAEEKDEMQKKVDKKVEKTLKKQDHTGLSNADRLKMIQGAAGIYFFFTMYGRMQERIFQFRSPSGHKFQAVWFLSLVDAAANVLVGGIGRQFQGITPGLPQHLLAASGLTQVVSKYCLSASLAAGLSFPVATLAKSAKLVPVMIGSLLLGGSKFSARQISQAAAIVGGTSIVTLSEGGKGGKTSSMSGLAFILASLWCDGLVGGSQKRLKSACAKESKKVLAYDMMFWTNLYMALAAAAFAAVRGEIRQGASFCRANPVIQQQVLKFGICGALGQASVFYMIANFDTVVCTSVTTTRKLLSVLISIFESGKTLPPMGWAGFCTAAAGIMGEIL